MFLFAETLLETRQLLQFICYHTMIMIGAVYQTWAWWLPCNYPLLLLTMVSPGPIYKRKTQVQRRTSLRSQRKDLDTLARGLGLLRAGSPATPPSPKESPSPLGYWVKQEVAPLPSLFITGHQLPSFHIWQCPTPLNVFTYIFSSNLTWTCTILPLPPRASAGCSCQSRSSIENWRSERGQVLSNSSFLPFALHCFGWLWSLGGAHSLRCGTDTLPSNTVLNSFANK